ncbi:MAG TPA: hypothetical protein VGG10_23280 [Rhizomicrobium sp.]|jgi:hypothetical protein
MTSANDDGRALRLAPQEGLFLFAAVLVWAGYVVALGKDTSWDFRNYHWYIPYAYLNGRMGIDIAVAHMATYYNPLLDVPFYWLAIHTPAWFALGSLGAVQGANVVPLYIIARQTLQFPENRLAAAALALLGMTGGLTLGLAGTTYYDNVMSVFTLSSLAMLIGGRETLTVGPLVRAAAIAAIAGFVCGTAAGLKLPETPFTFGFAAALIALGGTWRNLLVRTFAGGAGGALGFFLFGGLWMLHMQHLTGNPLFPYFNNHYHSPLAAPVDYHDTRFLQPFHDQIILPILFSLDWRVTDDLPYQDIRIGLAYFALIVAAIGWVIGLFLRRPREPLTDPTAGRAIVAFVIVTFIVWVKLFCIYRYILALEMLAPTVIAVAIASLPIGARARFVTAGATFFLALLFSHPQYSERVPVSDPFVEALAPKITNPEKAMILLTGQEPLGFLAPSFSPKIPIVRIDGWMYQSSDNTGLTRLAHKRVTEQLKKRHYLYLVADAEQMTRAHDALEDYNLAILWQKCRLFDTNIAGTYQLCPVGPWPPGLPHRKGLT